MSTEPIPKKLADIWKKKLAKSGFMDIEPVEGMKLLDTHEVSTPAHHLKQMKTETILEFIKITNETKQDYFDKAREFSIYFKFKNVTERKIWSLHAEGMPVRDISKELKGKFTSKSRVSRIICRLKEVMLHTQWRKWD